MTSTVGVPDLTGAIDTVFVGAGGRGLTLSLLLADYGADHLQIERHPDTAIQPKASYLNQRTMEIFRQHDVSEAVYGSEHRPRTCSRSGGAPRWAVTTRSTDKPRHGRRLILAGGRRSPPAADERTRAHPPHHKIHYGGN